jgi:hypothetical protein
MWSCPQCLLSRDIQDAVLIVIMVVFLAIVIGMVAKRNGLCSRCPDVPMPVMRVIHAWTH